MTEKIVLGLIGSLFFIQFVQINKEVPKVDTNRTFESFYGASDMMALTKEACYDCHSYQTIYTSFSHNRRILLKNQSQFLRWKYSQ